MNRIPPHSHDLIVSHKLGRFSAAAVLLFAAALVMVPVQPSGAQATRDDTAQVSSTVGSQDRDWSKFDRFDYFDDDRPLTIQGGVSETPDVRRDGLRHQAGDDGTGRTGSDGAAQNSGGQSANGPGGSTVEDDYVANEILILNDHPTLIQRARALGFTAVERISLGALGMELVRLRTPQIATTEEALAFLRDAIPGIVADLNATFSITARNGGWPAAEIAGWPRSRASCGIGTKIGMIDTAVDVTHPALIGQGLVHRDFVSGRNAAVSPEHGTAVAALLIGDSSLAEFTGLLPGAQLFAANIFEKRADGRTVANLLALVRALNWVTGERVQVINMSIAGGRNTILTESVKRAIRTGVVVVAAAGNGGANAKPAYPAAYEDVLAATAIDPSLTAYRYANRGTYIDFAAPGVDLWTAAPGGGKVQSGTSFAAPFLTAAAAMQLAAGTAPNAAAIRTVLARSARDLGQPGKDTIYGWGLLTLPAACG